MPTSAYDSVSILGMDISAFDSYDDALSAIRHRILSRMRTFCVAMNPEKLYRAKHDPQLEKVLRSADIRICDGIGVSLASAVLHRRRIPRCTGIDLFLRLIRLCEEEHLSIFLLGAAQETNEAACRVLMRRYPRLRIGGHSHGFFDDVNPVIDSINASGSDLLFVAMGSPRQEIWIANHMGRLKPQFCMGIGGTLDVVSGAVKRAPAFFRNTGTEWLYRLLSQPSRIRRQAVLPVFAFEVFKALGRA